MSKQQTLDQQIAQMTAAELDNFLQEREAEYEKTIKQMKNDRKFENLKIRKEIEAKKRKERNDLIKSCGEFLVTQFDGCATIDDYTKAFSDLKDASQSQKSDGADTIAIEVGEHFMKFFTAPMSAEEYIERMDRLVKVCEERAESNSIPASNDE